MRHLILSALIALAATPVAAQVATPGADQAPPMPAEGWEVTLAILPTADGELANCRFEAVLNPEDARPVEGVRPSDRFIAAACERLSRETGWLVSHDEEGAIMETFDSCRMTSTHSDRPLCRVDEDA